jgi:hypothetical protein
VAGCVAVADGNRTIKTIKGTKGQVLRQGENSVEWGDDTPNRAVKILESGKTATTDILDAASLTTLQFNSGDNIYITKESTAG